MASQLQSQPTATHLRGWPTATQLDLQPIDTHLLSQASDAQSQAQLLASESVTAVPVKRTVVEKVAPVNPRCFRRAMTPPITLKTFFKPLVKKETTDNKELGMTNEICQSPKTTETAVEGNSSEKNVNGNEMKYEDFCQTLNGKKSEKKLSSNSSGDKNAELCKIEENSPNDTAERLSRKRPAKSSDSVQKSKRAKQSTLFSSFAKQKEMKVEEKKCPICQTTFANDVTSDAINSHIDSCLIE